MLSEALPIYSGGLGNVAGDQLKAASDLGVPVVGVGLLYQQGYFRQVIDRDGAQQALYPYNDPGQLPITPLRQANGEWLRLEIPLPGYSVWLRAWQVQVGRVKLYLLDSNDAANFPAHRGITSELYGGGPELRLKQEIVLGIGGWRLLACARPPAGSLSPERRACGLRRAGTRPDFHGGDGPALRGRAGRHPSGQSVHHAHGGGRGLRPFFSGPHGAVPRQVCGAEARQSHATTCWRSDARTRTTRRRASTWPTWQSAGAGRVNGVSRLHGQVSRQLFEPLFPRWPAEEVPVGHVTNGVHMPTWDSAAADDLWTGACGKDRWLGTTETLEQDIRRVSDASFWQLRTAASQSLVEYVRERLSRQLTASGASAEAVDTAGRLFDPNALTLGFARRFATYKRPNMLLHDRERLLRLLTDPHHPVQLVLAGKAHPADQAGQALIQEWIHFIRRPEVRPHVIFLSDYDMLLTERLVQGVDVWINTPRRPWEACGTSGMKVLVNGGINLSELDGWWAEAYTPEVGWALGDGQEHGDDPAWDAVEANALYDLLEREVIPEFYAREESGIPVAWVKRMRESMARLTPRFSASRTVREYTEQHYLPAAAAYHLRIADRGTRGRQMVDWRHTLDETWPALRFGEVKVETRGDQHVFEVEVCFNGLDPKAVRVELYADGVRGGAPVRHEMTLARQRAGAAGGHVYNASVPSARPPSDYTARAIPHCDGVAIPLELARILWQR